MAAGDVVVYTQPGCASCQQVKRFLAQGGIPFTEKNIREDVQAVRELTALGSQGVPTMVIDGEVIIGFDPRRLRERLRMHREEGGYDAQPHADECSTRCLAPAVAAAARAELTAEQVRPVAFTCRLSGAPAVAVVIGDAVAAQLLAAAPIRLHTLAEARSLASLAGATLCACDVATLLDQSQPVAETLLRTLTTRGLVAEQTIQGMPYFNLTALGRVLVEQVFGVQAQTLHAQIPGRCGCSS